MKRLKLTKVATAKEIAHQLVDLMPAFLWQLLRKIGDISAENGLPVYLVGGVVRDLWLGKPAVDIDFVVEGDGIALATAVQEKLGGELETYERFGTAKWLTKQELPIPAEIDFVTARDEFYPQPTALPVVTAGSIAADLRRRDFTINTLAIRLDGAHLGELLDLYGGLEDLENGIIRVLHPLSFQDDPTRILRAIRFEQRFDFVLEAQTHTLLTEALPWLKEVTGARMRHEIELALAEEDIAKVLQRFDEMGVLKQLHPDLGWQEEMAGAMALLQEEMPAFLQSPHWQLQPNDPIVISFILWLLPFSIDIQKAVARRLRVRQHTLEDLLATKTLIEALMRSTDPSVSEITATIRTDAKRGRILPAIFVYFKHRGDNQRANWAEAYQTNWQYEKTMLSGNDLMKMGVPQGRLVGQLLAGLLAERLNAGISTIDEEKSWVSATIKAYIQQG